MRDVETRAANPNRVLILRHVDLLPPNLARATEHALRRYAVGQVLATSASGASDAEDNPIISGARSLLQVPPLRERLEDLPALFDVFTARAAVSGRVVHWLPDAVQTLSRVEWADNLIGLDSLVQRIVPQLRGDRIGVRDLPADILVRATRRRSRLEHAEAQTIIQSLREAGGNKQHAAESLGIARSTLYRKMRALGLDLSSTIF